MHYYLYLFLDKGGYGYLKEWLWWAGMLLSKFKKNRNISSL
jgi:hypothetical protein